MISFLLGAIIGAIIGSAIVLSLATIKDVVRNLINQRSELDKFKDALKANELITARINKATQHKVSMTVFSSLGDMEDVELEVKEVDDSIKIGEYYYITD